MFTMAVKSHTGRATARIAVVHRHMSSAAVPNIVIEEKGAARLYTLDRPKSLNALSHDMFVGLSGKADEWREDPHAKLVIGQGDGRAFSAGGDIKAVVESVRSGNSPRALQLMADSYRLNWKLAQVGKPYVAIIDGIVMGGGAGISLPAPIRIATKRSMFAMPEQRIGFSPEAGSSYYLSQLDGYIGTWLAVTGTDVYGRAAYDLGLATHYVAEEDIPEVVSRLVALEEPTTDAISAVVSEFHIAGNDGPSSKSNPDGASRIHGDIRRFLDETFSLPSLSSIYRRLQHAETNGDLGPDVQQWAAEQRATMATRGPTGMAVVIENYRLSAEAKQYATAIDHDLLVCAAFAGAHRASNDLVVGAVHSLFDKKKTPIPFNPDIGDLDNPILDPENIRSRFLTRANLPDAQEGDLYPTPLAYSGPDAHWGLFRRYGTPSEAAVRSALGTDCTSVDELVRRVLGNSTDARRNEFELDVRKMAAENIVQDGEPLRWKA